MSNNVYLRMFNNLQKNKIDFTLVIQSHNQIYKKTGKISKKKKKKKKFFYI